MAEARLVRILPARKLVVTSPADAALATAVASMAAEKFAQRTAPGAVPVIFEYGSFGSALLGGIGFGLLPGRIGKRGWTVVDCAAGPAETTITFAHISGMQVADAVRRAIERTRAAYDAAGVLVDAGEPISSYDLPESSLGNPDTFRASGFLSANGRWVTA
ncbi:hypothetical protein BH11ACT5_BH11ACT5_23600 [soil metagenome]